MVPSVLHGKLVSIYKFSIHKFAAVAGHSLVNVLHELRTQLNKTGMESSKYGMYSMVQMTILSFFLLDPNLTRKQFILFSIF